MEKERIELVGVFCFSFFLFFLVGHNVVGRRCANNRPPLNKLVCWQGAGDLFALPLACWCLPCEEAKAQASVPSYRQQRYLFSSVQEADDNRQRSGFRYPDVFQTPKQRLPTTMFCKTSEARIAEHRPRIAAVADEWRLLTAMHCCAFVFIIKQCFSRFL